MPIFNFQTFCINDGPDVFNGGMTWQTLGYALWEPFVCLGAVIGLSSLFGAHLNKRGKGLGVLPPNAYAVYVIHPAVLVTLTFVFAGLILPTERTRFLQNYL
jgi:glucans biosynthesis protein C